MFDALARYSQHSTQLINNLEHRVAALVDTWASQVDAMQKKLDTIAGVPSKHFQSWIAHPEPDAFWDSFNPTTAQYAKIDLPILTITGQYDGDQAGAFAHYREHFAHGSDAAKQRHYLIIGPWDHAGTRTPQDLTEAARRGSWRRSSIASRAPRMSRTCSTAR